MKPRAVGARRLDIAAIREALVDDRMHGSLGIVTDIDDSGSHYELDGDDLLIEVELVPSGTRITARMGLCGGGPAAGLWLIPPVGAEVAVMIPEGNLAASPTIVGVLSTGSLPDGIAPDVMVIASPSKVLIHDGSGGAAALALKSDVQALVDTFNSHIHQDGPGPGAPTSVPVAPASVVIVTPAGSLGGGLPVNDIYSTGSASGASNPAGTQILEAK